MVVLAAPLGFVLERFRLSVRAKREIIVNELPIDTPIPPLPFGVRVQPAQDHPCRQSHDWEKCDHDDHLIESMVKIRHLADERIEDEIAR